MVALDAIGINLIGITALVSILLNTTAYLEVILLIGILAFIGTVAFSKFLEIDQFRSHHNVGQHLRRTVVNFP